MFTRFFMYSLFQFVFFLSFAPFWLPASFSIHHAFLFSILIYVNFIHLHLFLFLLFIHLLARTCLINVYSTHWYWMFLCLDFIVNQISLFELKSFNGVFVWKLMLYRKYKHFFWTVVRVFVNISGLLFTQATTVILFSLRIWPSNNHLFGLKLHLQRNNIDFSSLAGFIYNKR